MTKNMVIPVFPLNLLPLPGEMVPLHIFEPRYRQLLYEAESLDINFGIYFNSQANTEQIGSLMRLESIVKRYPDGESDVIVKCMDIFTMNTMYRTFKDKMYPGASVCAWNVDFALIPDEHLYNQFIEYLALRNIDHQFSLFTIYQIAIELNLDLEDRQRFLLSGIDKKEVILQNKLKLLIYLLEQELKSRDVFHLN